MVHYSQATFKAAITTDQDVHPVRSIMQVLAGSRPVSSSADLIRMRDGDLAFWANIHGPSGDLARAGVYATWNGRIAAAKRREAAS